MPTPIQSSSVTAKLRSFFRLRGRQIFSLDETVVPTAQVEDLTAAPYRGNHQVRWKTGRLFNPAILPARRFMIVVNTSRAPVMDLSKVPGVAVIEQLELWTVGANRDWRFSLIHHQGFLQSVEPGAVVTSIGANVDAAFTVPVPALGVKGQVPIRLNGVQENVAPNLEARLELGIISLEPAPDSTAYRAIPAEQVTIGDNVALLIRNELAAAGGLIGINVSGTYYPLARS